MRLAVPPLQVRVWVPAAVMRRAQARLVAGGPREQVLTVELRSDFHIARVPLEVRPDSLLPPTRRYRVIKSLTLQARCSRRARTVAVKTLTVQFRLPHRARAAGGEPLPGEALAGSGACCCACMSEAGSDMSEAGSDMDANGHRPHGSDVQVSAFCSGFLAASFKWHVLRADVRRAARPCIVL